MQAELTLLWLNKIDREVKGGFILDLFIIAGCTCLLGAIIYIIGAIIKRRWLKRVGGGIIIFAIVTTFCIFGYALIEEFREVAP